MGIAEDFLMNVEVLDPRKEGYDFAAHMALLDENREAALAKHQEFSEKVLDTPVGNATLRDFLFREDGYLQPEGVRSVMFVNGGLWSESDGHSSRDRASATKATGSIPFVFTILNKEQYLTKS